MADLERLILSGEFFNPRSRSPSPTRSASPDWDRDYTHDEEYDASTAKNAQIEKMLGGPTDVAAEEGGIGVGVQGRTGVKGVIRDRAEAEARTKQKRSRDASDLAKRMERSALTGRTWKEDEAAAKLERALENGTQLSEDEDEDDDNGRKDVWGAPKGRFGHLREVGISGFVGAVEDERGTWVLVHLYDASLERCYTLDDTLSQLAHIHPNTKFLRARAGVLGFASTKKTARPTSSSLRAPRNKRFKEEDEDDPYGSDDDENTGDDLDEDDVDTDVLPTLLAYRDGELVHTWVRVDWEAEAMGNLEELLVRHHVIEPQLLLGARVPNNDLSDNEL